MILNDRQTLCSDIKFFNRKLGTITNKYNLIRKTLNKIKNDSSEEALKERYKLLNSLENLNGSIIRHKRLVHYLKDYLEIAFPEEKE